MKKILLVIGVVLFVGMSYAQKISKYAPQIVLIGIGEKNQSLAESDFPDLNFYYTPGIKLESEAGATGQAIVNLSNVASFEVSGSPDFIVNMWNDKEVDKAFFLFDKNGVCATQGYDLLRQGGNIAGRLCIDKKSLNDHLVNIVKKGKNAKPAKKEMNMKKSNFMLGHKFPAFEVADVEGNSVSIQSVLDGKPSLVVFFHLPANIDVHEAEQSFKGKSGKSFIKAMVASTSGSSDIGFFQNIQDQFFQK